MPPHPAPKTNNINDKPIWSPSAERIAKSRLKEFMDVVADKTGRDFGDYASLWSWSIAEQETFWDLCWDFTGVIGEKGSVILEDPGHMIDARFFPQARLNYAENLLRRRDDQPAIIFRDEKGAERILTFAGLYEEVAHWQAALKDLGIEKGDRIAGYLPNMPETVIAMLAAVSLGAIWSSASPDFGVSGVLDRFGQIEPKLLIGVDGYYYNGKTIDCLDKISKVQDQIDSLDKTVIIPFLDDSPDISALNEKSVTAKEFLPETAPDGDIEFEAVPFDHPLFIMFSSGTTGSPKCIVHGHGGTLVQHLKEFQLHCDIGSGDRVFYFTTCGWMMWNWLVSGLACEATLLLYDGSPFYPDGNCLWDYTSAHDCKLFGTSAKYIDALNVHGIHPKNSHDLSSVELLTSTGSPLMHEGFDFVYDHIKSDVHLAPIYGGTDIISASFGIGNPISPVYRGEMQGPALATAIEIYDEDGQGLAPGGGCGELVLTKPIPSMPIGFWNDPGNARYKAAYFDMYGDVWRHGDWAEWTVHNNGLGLIVHGRSDATLNPGGVRIGTAEIYRQVEQLDDVVESIVVGQKWDKDVRVVLFVVMREGKTLTDDLRQAIRKKIRAGASPRHVPAKILEVTDIPRTKSGKITEIAVRKIIHGEDVKNRDALKNPEALDLYKDRPELQED